MHPTASAPLQIKSVQPQRALLAERGVMHDRRVLVFPAGTEIGLEIFSALHGCRNVHLFAAGEDLPSHARLLYPAYHIIPNVRAEGWLNALMACCARLNIGYIFPAHDDALLALSQVRDLLPATVVAPSNWTCEITRSKRETYRQLAALINTPDVIDSPQEVRAFPVFVKPDRGQGSLNAVRVDDHPQLLQAVRVAVDPLICEYLPGEEYTVDCFSSIKQGLLFCHARRRGRIRSGISNHTQTLDLSGIQAMAQIISDRLAMRGAWFFQVKRSAKGAHTLLEVAPRIAGAMAAHRVTGVNFAMLSLMEQDGLDLCIQTNSGEVELDRCLRNRYRHSIAFDSLYIDLDDTLILKGTVHVEAVKLIFQCINAGKRVVLLSRHASNIHATLKLHRLQGLFDDVIHLRDGSPKSAHIRMDDKPIFVDDSFSERREVHSALGIPTFDLSMIELLTEQAVTECSDPLEPSLRSSHG